MSQSLEGLTSTQKLILLLLGVNSFKPVLNHLRLQKMLTYFLLILGENDNERRDLLMNAGFYPHKKGPYSELIEEEMNQMALEGLIDFEGDPTTARNIRLTPRGKEIFEELINKLSQKRHISILEEIKKYLNDQVVTDDEILAIIYLDILGQSELGKEFISKSTEIRRIEKDRTLYALRLYKKGKISLGKAAELAGLSISQFKDLLN